MLSARRSTWKPGDGIRFRSNLNKFEDRGDERRSSQSYLSRQPSLLAGPISTLPVMAFSNSQVSVSQVIAHADNACGYSNISKIVVERSNSPNAHPRSITNDSALHICHCDNRQTSEETCVKTANLILFKSSRCVEEDHESCFHEQFPLAYHISNPKLQRSELSSSLNNEVWSFKLYESPEGEKPKAHYCTTLESFERVAKIFQNERILGFDLEWKSYATAADPWWHNVSVLQLASQSQIGVFHLAMAARESSGRDNSEKGKATKDSPSSQTHDVESLPVDIIPSTLRSLLESDDIVKVGVNIGNDRTRLLNHCGIKLQASFELSHLYKLVKYSTSREYHKINRKPVALQIQVQEELCLPMSKGEVRLSNWALNRLDRKQIMYAASDAYAGLILFYTMESKRKNLRPIPPRPEFYELKLPIRLPEGVGPSEIKPNRVEGIPDSSIDLEKKEMVKSAHAFAQKCLSEYHTRPKLPPASLRAYFLWHHKLMKLDQICHILRSPPLQLKTVAKYVRTAVEIGKLEHDRIRFSNEIKCSVYLLQ